MPSFGTDGFILKQGADSAIYQRLEDDKSPVAVATWNHLGKFASEGLRTLCVAYRFLDFNMYQSWNKMFQEARSSLTDREQRIHQVRDQFECYLHSSLIYYF